MFEDERDDEFEPNYENIDDTEARQSNLWLRVAIGVVALLIVSILVALPVLRVLASNDQSDRIERQAAIGAAQLFVAEHFSAAVLDYRSTWRGTFWAMPTTHAEIDAIVGFLQSRDSHLLDGAQRSLARVACRGQGQTSPNTGGGAECFHAWLRAPDGTEIVRIAFTVAIINGSAQVVSVSRVAAV